MGQETSASIDAKRRGRGWFRSRITYSSEAAMCDDAKGGSLGSMSRGRGAFSGAFCCHFNLSILDAVS